MSAWPIIFGLAGSAVAAGALVVPAARAVIFGSVKFDWVAGEVEIDRIEPDGMTVRCKPRGRRSTGTVFRAYRLAGTPYDTKPEGQQVALHEGRSTFFLEVGKAGAVARLFGVKRHREVVLSAEWPSATLREVGRAEASLYKDAFEWRWYMTVQASTYDALERVDERVLSMLAPYHPRRVTRSSDPNGPCELSGLVHYLLCGDLRDDLRPVSRNVSASVPGADLVFGGGGTFTAHAPVPYYHRVVTVSAWPELVSGHLLHELASIPGEIEVSLICVPIGRDAAIFELDRKAKNQFGSSSAAEESVAMVELLKAGSTTLFNTQLIVVARARSEAAVSELVAEIARLLAQRRVDYKIETKGAPVAWFNRLPDHEALLRPLRLDQAGVSALWPFEGAPTGLLASHWGAAPLRSFMTGSGQAYAAQLQCTDQPKALGNFLVVAPAGSGKSTLMMHLLGGLAKFPNVPAFVFDSKEGARFMIEALGGVYQSFDKLSLNPLDAEDSPINRQRLALLIRAMLGPDGQSTGVDDLLAHAVDSAFRLPVEGRRFDTLYPVMFPRNSDEQKSFAKWVTSDHGRAGLYARVFNAERDALSGFLGSSHLTGINMNEALEDPILGPPVVAHIAAGVERMARRESVRGFAIFVDEAAKLLTNPAFKSLVAEMYREYRKLFGSVGLAFQDPSALHASGISSAVIENTASFFFFPNPQGDRASYEPFRLNDEQLAFVFGGAGQVGRRVLLVKRDAATGFEESVILNIDLSPLGDALRFYRSGPDAVRDLLRLQAQWGDEWPSRI